MNVYSSLTSSQITSVGINLGVFVIIVLLSWLLIKKLNFPQKGYKPLFVLYTIFWIPLMLLRAVTGTMNKPMSADEMLWLPMAAYGFIGIFARIFADVLGHKTKSRKSFIYFAIFIQIVTYIPILCFPCTCTNVIQSLGVGVGASSIGTYQLLFNEQYGKSKQFLTVSILSIPPLLADFISSPIQSVFKSFCTNSTNDVDPSMFKYIWLVGLGFVLICLALSFYIKEDRSYFEKDVKYKDSINTRNEWIYYVGICLLGSLIAFIKFANSGAIAQLHLDKLFGGDNEGAPYYGYLSLIFSLGQLAGGLLTGLVLVKKIGKLHTVSIGCGVWIIYHILTFVADNPYAYMVVHVLNGFSYGIIYNLILGFVLMRTFKIKSITPMGVYQSILSVGITFSNFFTSWLKEDVLDKPLKEYMKVSDLINGIIIALMVLTWLVFAWTYIIEKSNYQRLWFKKSDFKKKAI